MRNKERVAEELRILRAAADGRLRVNEHGRWVIDGDKPPMPKARKYLQSVDCLTDGWHPSRAPVSLTRKGRVALDWREADAA